MKMDAGDDDDHNAVKRSRGSEREKRVSMWEGWF